MSVTSENNKRIAKNTIVLYIRMLLVMLVSFYTVRVVLRVLGEENYGIYNVVGGIVVMFSFLARTLASASNRYFAFDLGRNDYEHLKKVFSVTLILYALVSLAIVVLGETVGLWFLHNKMTIPAERMVAADWVYQVSVISFCISLLATPYQAIIIAHERMGVYAYIGILEVILKLGLVLLLSLVEFYDRLILYAILMFLSHLIVEGSYFVYATRRIQSSRFKYYWEGKLAKEIASFSGWNFFGALSTVIRGQGINILLNTFFSPVINAARGIAESVNSALTSFSSNFFTAVRPQITKYYSQGENEETIKLVFRSSRLTFYLLLFISVPTLVFVKPILTYWLVIVPDYTVIFTELVICTALIDSLSYSLMTLSQATGNVKLYQAIVGSITIMNLPVSWFFLRLGYNPAITAFVTMTLSVFAQGARILILRRAASFPVRNYFTDVIKKVTTTGTVTILLVFLIKYFVFSLSPSLFMLIICFGLSTILSTAVILFVGMTRDEREWGMSFIRAKVKRNNSKA